MKVFKSVMLAAGAVFTGVALLAMPAAAQSDVASDLLTCERLKDNDVRLACFSAIAAKMRGGETSVEYAAPRPPSDVERRDDVVNIPRSYVERASSAPPPSGLGEEQLRRPDRDVQSETPKRFVANIVRHWDKPFGNFAVELDNGQVWESTEKSRLALKDVQTVEIYRGLLSGYRLKAKGETGMARVKRVR